MDDRNELLKHILDNGSFGCMDDDSNDHELQKLEKEGLVKSFRAPSWMVDDVVYRLTDKGETYIVDATTLI
jgi:hypothetical protein